jgi:hypothetical protein
LSLQPLQADLDARTYAFDVDVSTHDLLKRHVVVGDRRRVVVLVEPGENYLDASLLAYALAALDDVVITGVWWRY